MDANAHHEPDAGTPPSRARAASVDFLVPSTSVAKPRAGEAETSRRARIRSVYLVWTAQPDGSLGDSVQWRDFTGQILSAVARDDWLGAIHPDDRTRARRIWAEALTSKTPFALECRVRQADRHYRRLLLRGVPMLHDDGSVREWVLTGTSVAACTERDTVRARARQLEVILETMADGVIVFDRDLHFRAMNPAARRLLALDVRPDFFSLPIAEVVRHLHVRDARGQPYSTEKFISDRERVLAGETHTGAQTVENVIRALDGRDVALSLSEAPVHDARGNITAAVVIQRDVTERRRLEQRTQEALAALVAMAEELVSAGVVTADGARSPGDASPHTPGASASAIARRLADMTQRVTGARRVGIVATGLNEEDGARLVAGSSMSAQEEEHFRTRWPWAGKPIAAILPPAFVSRLVRGESVPIDFAQPEFARLPNPYRASSLLLTPMRLGGRLVGFMVLDYESVAYEVTPDELALAMGAARLAALVLERERLQRERAEARANELALREANRRMDEFLAVAAHELRSPVMAGLLGVGLAQRHAHELQNRATAREGALAGQLDVLQRDVTQVGESVERLARLVTDLSDVSRIRAGQLDIRPEPADLAAIVRKEVTRQHVLAPSRDTRLRLPTTVPIPVLVDVDRIGQVVSNLLGNALKYAPENRPVEVRVQVRGGRARVSIRDEGPGLPLEEQRRIWERYHQAPGIRANVGTSVGLGLGLYISREIVRAHGGRVGVQSAPGRGSIFWFTLPLDDAVS
jgi:signal transduction histidine kinase/PAS domain-containing protein